MLIEIPRGSFIKRGSTWQVDFVSPLPCPFNYGSVPQFVGLEGDLLDAVVLGPRLPLGVRTVRCAGWGVAVRHSAHVTIHDLEPPLLATLQRWLTLAADPSSTGRYTSCTPPRFWTDGKS